MHLPKSKVKRRWAYLGGAALLAGIWVFPTQPHVVPEAMPIVPASQTQVAEAPKAVEQPQQVTKRYTVEAGDTLSGIAARYGIDVETLTAANPGISDLIHPGDQLVILPQKGLVHQVNNGDTLWDIAHTYGVPVETIKSANTKGSDQITVGERLFIPGAHLARAETVVARASVSRFFWPTRGEISSDFGWRWGRLHAGIDIANDTGTYVVAARAGQIIWAGWRGGYGYTVMIDHGGGYISLYGHLDDYNVERGQYVRGGQRIASMGNTGNSTGPHLHFEIQKNGEPVDPTGFLP
ncbi:MAG: spore coat assembly protein SafA [Firmicutes bacterium]|nr:spore coat assembly protein SafA [Bacillota bacterium]